MGFESRDYARTDRRDTLGPTSGWTIVGWLIAINVAVFIVQCIWTRPASNLLGNTDGMPYFGSRISVLDDWFSLDPRAVLKGQIWRLTTYDFLHTRENLFHILFNMMVLYFAGRKLLDRYSEREFFWLYMVAGVISGLAFLAWQVAFREWNPAIGASGAVAAIMVVYAVHWPWDRWIIFYVIPVPAVWVAIGAAVFDLYPLLLKLGGTEVPSGVAHVAHIGGMAFGYLYARNGWSLVPWVDWIISRNPLRRKPRLRVVRDEEFIPPPRGSGYEQRLKERMDEVLAKISAEGQASLTPEEQRDLNEASRYFRNLR